MPSREISRLTHAKLAELAADEGDVDEQLEALGNVDQQLVELITDARRLRAANLRRVVALLEHRRSRAA